MRTLEEIHLDAEEAAIDRDLAELAEAIDHLADATRIIHRSKVRATMKRAMVDQVVKVMAMGGAE